MLILYKLNIYTTFSLYGSETKEHKTDSIRIGVEITVKIITFVLFVVVLIFSVMFVYDFSFVNEITPSQYLMNYLYPLEKECDSLDIGTEAIAEQEEAVVEPDYTILVEKVHESNEEPELTWIDGILVVNKTYSLPKSYAPGWETEASPHLWEMISDAKSEGIELWMSSGYRSWYDQQYIYNGYVAEDGQEAADRYSARPGHSEHQTGLAYDLNDLSHDFGETPEGKWVAGNCYKYGFIIRYPKEKEHITGYIYEPWHIRYLGVEKATEVYESGLCLEEFLGITSVYS